MKTFKIYKHTNKINNKVYIGQTCKSNPLYRWHNDGSGYKDCIKFYRAIKKYGWDNFNHEIIEDNILTQEEANEREKYWIQYYNSYNKGYNNDLGGNSSNYLKKPIYQLDKDKNIIKQYKSITEAETSLHIYNISCCCNKKYKRAGGYYWCFVDDYNDYIIDYIKFDNSSRPIYQLDIYKNIINIFNSIVDAENYLGIKNSNIGQCCNNKRRQCANYYWCFVDDYTNYEIKQPFIQEIQQYSLDDKLLNTFSSARAIEYKLGFAHTLILDCCKGKYKQAYGYKWQYKEL